MPLPPWPYCQQLIYLSPASSRQLRGAPPRTEPVVWLPPATMQVNDGAISLRELRAVRAATHSPQTLCAKSGCACPPAQQWPATKFLVKRVSRAPDLSLIHI